MAEHRIFVESRGIVGDGETLNTSRLQNLLDELDGLGGGELVLTAPGVYLTGTLLLHDNITLRIDAGATLLGSPQIEDYLEQTAGHNKDRQPYHLLVAEGVENIVIEGKGCIDGNGEAFWQTPETDENGKWLEPRWLLAKDKKVSPLIELVRCRNVTVRDVTIKTGGGWNIHAFDCDRFRVDGVNIDCNFYSPNSDGIDLTGCHDVMISNCYIRTCDDAIVLKTLPDSRTCERITVTNCVLETACVALKLGATESYKDMRDVTFSNCVVHQSNRAFALYTMAGGDYTNIAISNITANTRAPFVLSRPIHIMATSSRCPEGVRGGTIRNVSVSNFIAETQGRILIHADPDCCIENLRLRDLMLSYPYIEDAALYAGDTQSAQFPRQAEGSLAGGANAAVVVENVNNLFIDGLHISWPAEDQPVPEDWRAPERLANGRLEPYQPDYRSAVPVAFSAIWLNRVKGGYLHAPMLVGAGGADAVISMDSAGFQTFPEGC